MIGRKRIIKSLRKNQNPYNASMMKPYRRVEPQIFIDSVQARATETNMTTGKTIQSWPTPSTVAKSVLARVSAFQVRDVRNK